MAQNNESDQSSYNYEKLQVEYFDPSELQLDLSDQKDLAVWVDSGGDRPTAEFLIAEKNLYEEFYSGPGAINDNEFTRADYLDADQLLRDAVVKRRQQLFPPEDV